MFPRTKGDTAYPPILTCLADDEPVNLSGSTVTLRMEAGDTVKTPSFTLSDQVTNRGELVPDFAPGDVDTVGNWALLVLVVFPNGMRATFRGPYLPIIG